MRVTAESQQAIERALAEGRAVVTSGPGCRAPGSRKQALVAAAFEPPGTWTIPLHVTAGDNSRGFARRIGRAGKERTAVGHALARHLAWVAPFAWLIHHKGERVRCRLTRLGRTMDDDNVQASLKYVRDTVALFLGVDDGARVIVWEYCQEQSALAGVRIQLEAIHPTP